MAIKLAHDFPDLVRYLVDSGRAVKVTSQLLYPAALWDELVQRLRRHFLNSPTLTMAAFKEMAQVSRKYAVPMLEHLDRTGLTRRQGDDRVPGPKLEGKCGERTMPCNERAVVLAVIPVGARQRVEPGPRATIGMLSSWLLGPGYSPSRIPG